MNRAYVNNQFQNQLKDICSYRIWCNQVTYQFLVFEGLSGNHGWRCISFGLHSLQTVIHQIIQLNSSANERFWDQVKQSILKSQTLIEITINCTTTIQYLSIPSQILNVNGVLPPTNITICLYFQQTKENTLAREF